MMLNVFGSILWWINWSDKVKCFQFRQSTDTWGSVFIHVKVSHLHATNNTYTFTLFETIPGFTLKKTTCAWKLHLKSALQLPKWGPELHLRNRKCEITLAGVQTYYIDTMPNYECNSGSSRTNAKCTNHVIPALFNHWLSIARSVDSYCKLQLCM